VNQSNPFAISFVLVLQASAYTEQNGHDKTISYLSQKLQIHKGRLYGFLISSLTDKQIRKAPKLVKELKQIAQSFSFTN